MIFYINGGKIVADMRKFEIKVYNIISSIIIYKFVIILKQLILSHFSTFLQFGVFYDFT